MTGMVARLGPERWTGMTGIRTLARPGDARPVALAPEGRVPGPDRSGRRALDGIRERRGEKQSHEQRGCDRRKCADTSFVQPAQQQISEVSVAEI
jgi:hypothetical protein